MQVYYVCITGDIMSSLRQQSCSERLPSRLVSLLA